MTELSSVSGAMASDLASSGLTASDMKVRIAGEPELAAVSLEGGSGYVIPYYDLHGLPIAHYRVKVLSDPTPRKKPIKYKQPIDSKQHIYFAPNLLNLLASRVNQGKRQIIITEGEKKAAACIKAGIPCIGLGGVDSWRTRTIELPPGIEVKQPGVGQNYSIKMPSTLFDIKEKTTGYATGFFELVRMIKKNGLEVYIIYDRDTGSGTGIKEPVQIAAFNLAAELQIMGVDYGKIHQGFIPEYDEDEKIGLDDWLMLHNGDPSCLTKILERVHYTKASFPRHPTTKEFVDTSMNKTKIPRKDRTKTSIAIIADMDHEGRRMYNKDEKVHYYFSKSTGTLMRADFPNDRAVFISDFSTFLYRRYGISTNEMTLIRDLKTQFASTEPVEDVTPHRVFAYRAPATRDLNELKYQINDSQYVHITDSEETPIKIMDNSADGTLFLANQVDPLDASKVLGEFSAQLATYKKTGKLPFLWSKVFEHVRLKDHEKTHILASLVSYATPWLLRWKGLQAPLEFLIGEPGSGKSSLYQHRMNVIVGNDHASLANMPNDMKDFVASSTNAGGIFTIDNVNFADKKLQQQMSDELCRITTESNPYVDARAYYTNSDVIRFPMRATFAFTSVEYPFVKSDIMQRSFVIELDKGMHNVQYNPLWVQQQMNLSTPSTTPIGARLPAHGRTRWIAHHLLVCHLFFKKAQEWDDTYMAKSRLINFEQALLIMADLFNIKDAKEWLPDFLSDAISSQIESADWAFGALKDFALVHTQMIVPAGKIPMWSTTQIATWFSNHDEHGKSTLLTSPRSLGKYMGTNKNALSSSLGIIQLGKKNNVMHYGLRCHQKGK